MSAIDTHAQPAVAHTPSLSRPARSAANAVIIGLWLWLYRPVFDYLAIIFSREEFRTNQLVLVGVIVLIAVQMRTGRLRPRIDTAPHLFPPALILAFGGSALYLAVERLLDINTVSASLFGLASYGLLGLWMQPRRWRQGLPALLLVIGVLPFGEHIQTFVGYPMRILTAAIVRDGLTAASVKSISIDTILVFENGVSQVDLPCSGVKSLWTGMLFLIAATWIERRPLNLRWLLIALVFAGLLFMANLVRVGVLVVVGQVAGWRLAAEMLHVPLGVLGFVAACAAAVALLRLQRPLAPDAWEAYAGKQDSDSVSLVEGSAKGAEDPRPGGHAQPGDGLPALDRPVWLAPVLAAAILAMALTYTPRPPTGQAQPPPAWVMLSETKHLGLVTEPMPLTPREVEWLTRGGAESVERLRFAWRGITGSMILITSTTWRAQHRPEQCFQVYGLSLKDERTHLVTTDFPVRFVSLGYGNGHGRLSAAYWFQSAERTTDDYATRIWADLAPERERWVLVTMLFDSVHDPHEADLQALHIALHDAVRRNLRGGLP
jgi:exosortase/archaeosortase family protein